MKMNRIISDSFFYFHKGFLSNEWKKVRFELYSNGSLARISSDGVVEKKIDLKKVYSSIKIKSATEFFLPKLNEKKNQLPMNNEHPAFNKDSMLMIIPNRTGNKWVLLFLSADLLNEWMIHIKKWACVPKIKIDEYNENEDQSSIDFFKELRQSSDLCKRFSFKNNIFSNLRADIHSRSSYSSDTVFTDQKNENNFRPIVKSKTDSECKMLGTY